MATQKRKKKKQETLMDFTMKLRVSSLFVICLIVIAAFQFGPIGLWLHTGFSFLFGYFAYGIYAVLLGVCIYVLYEGVLPRLTGPEAIGSYLIFLSVLTITESVRHYSIGTGVELIQTYISSTNYIGGGFIGVLIYGCVSALVDNIGTTILFVCVFIVGCILLFGKMYVRQAQQKKKRNAKKKEEAEKIEEEILPSPSQTIILKKKNHFFDFFSKDEQVTIFPDDVFEDKSSKPRSTVQEDKSDFPFFEFDDYEAKINIKEPKKIEPDSIVEDKPLQPSKKVKTGGKYKLPPLSLLSTQSTDNSSKEKVSASKNASRLTTVLKQFGVNATIENAYLGPTITKYELKLETGTRVNRILQLQDDIKLALATADIRIEAPIPGKPYVGIEVPNTNASMVSFKEVFTTLQKSSKYKESKLTVALGKDVSGNPIYAELDKMPHLLIAGATGSGKSVCINTIISSILMRTHPDEVKLILVDPKKVELTGYNGVPHLLTPVVTDPKKAAAILREVVNEMERRYDLFASMSARNIKSYNEIVLDYNKKADKEDQKELLAYHVVILDEVADLMMVASKDVEDCIMRIAQMARAAGIHLIVATQRPSTDIITGVIKANIPSRIAFAVSSSIDSRTILDTSGAEKLLGKGDMLFSPMGASSPTRIQGAFVSDDEVASIVHYVSQQQEVEYEDRYTHVKAISSSSSFDDDDGVDEEYEMCREFVIKEQKASTSLLQRRFRIGYNKAARIIDQLEEDGIIGPQLGSKPREVYVREYSEEEA